MTDILIVPFAAVHQRIFSLLVDRIPELTGRTVGLGDPMPRPTAAYHSQRLQYEGDQLLDMLARQPSPARSVLGIIDADCFTPGLNFVFGQALYQGRESFIALARLRQGFYGLPEDDQLFERRVIKEAIHELGHTWGLAHCPDAECVMHFSNGLHDTDVKGEHFCDHCLVRVEPAPHAIPG